VPVPSEPSGPQTAAEIVAAKLHGLSLDRFFELSWRELVLRNPEAVVADGQAEFLGLEEVGLTDISEPYIRETYDVYATVLEILRTYNREGLNAEQQVSYDVYEWYLDDVIRQRQFMYNDYPATFFITAVHEDTLHFFTDLHPIADEQDARDYVTRLGKVGAKFDQLLEGLKLREDAGVVPPRFAVQWAHYGVRQIAEAAATGTPYYEAFDAKLGALPGLSAADRGKILAQAEEAIQVSVLPAYQALAAYLEHQQSVAPVEIGMWQYANGDAYYDYLLRRYTTTSLTSDEIHELGLRDLDRIHAEMRDVFDDLGYPQAEGLPQLFDRVEQDGGYVSGGSVIRTYEALIEQASQNLDQVFDLRPKAEVLVVESPIRGMYVAGAQDGSRPGVFHAGPGDATEARYAMPTLAYHEAVPGHHFQIALAQEADLPSFRNAIRFTSFSEGWALYAERLAWELGWYEDDPYGDLGRLQAEAFRAARLVIDTGIHAKGWSFGQALEYLIDNTGFEPGDSVNPEIQIARYAVWPGQALSYKIGMIKMLELRQRAMDRLGDSFDLKEYHNVVLSNGSLPLEIVERIVDDWIDEQLAEEAITLDGPIPQRSSFELDSAEVGDIYKIYVSLPKGYDPQSLQGYPVVYLLDGDWYFDTNWPTDKGGVARLVSDMVSAGTIPETILVGIGYAERNQRGRDFLWGYERFYAFLTEELVPYIDARYRTDLEQERTLLGHSDGGYFAVYAFLQYAPGEANPFGRFVALSGDFTKNEWAMFNEESKLHQRVGEGGVVDAALFMAVGGQEQVRFVDSNREMANRLETRDYQAFRFKASTFRAHAHMSIVPYAIPIGLNWVFNG
jgi:uncharacterized protein (DUF885 family)/enterochelin esterase-like enzyme